MMVITVTMIMSILSCVMIFFICRIFCSSTVIVVVIVATTAVVVIIVAVMVIVFGSIILLRTITASYKCKYKLKYKESDKDFVDFIIPLVFSTGSTVTTSSVSKCELTLPLTLYVDDPEEVFDFLFDFDSKIKDERNIIV